MFETLDTAPPDAILGLTEAFQQDANPHKINLTVGVYKDANGTTPILDCVKEAERRLLASESSKGYLAIDGMREYDQLVRELLFGPDHEIITSERAATAQSPGGTGALRVAADLLARKFPGTRIWVSNPTWANHPNVFSAAGLDVQRYDYLDQAGTGLDFDAMLASLQQIPQGDVLLLHACCHNPTGIDPTAEQWRRISDVAAERGLLPLVDFAYHGFGHGLSEDAAGLMELARPGREMLVCSSFSKNFGLYGERVGALTIVAGTSDAARAALSHAKSCIRSNYSNPPRHGAAIVAAILADPELRGRWEQELAAMRDRINGLRRMFAETMSQKAPGSDFSFITRQCGMFSYSGLNRMQVDRLRSEFSIYVVGDGRMNVAGMNEDAIDRLCSAIAAVL
ncbi:MAG: amino acid aminotransferase [Pirellulaceae bacterium]